MLKEDAAVAELVKLILELSSSAMEIILLQLLEPPRLVVSKGNLPVIILLPSPAPPIRHKARWHNWPDRECCRGSTHSRVRCRCLAIAQNGLPWWQSGSGSFARAI